MEILVAAILIVLMVIILFGVNLLVWFGNPHYNQYIKEKEITETEIKITVEKI